LSGRDGEEPCTAFRLAAQGWRPTLGFPLFDSLPSQLIDVLSLSFVFIDILGSFVEKSPQLSPITYRQLAVRMVSLIADG